MDDILIHAPAKKKLKALTNKVISILDNAGLKLNKEKCVSETERVKFLGHVFSSKILDIDSEKIENIQIIKPPKHNTQIQRLLGMVNYLAKFIPNMSELTAPIRERLRKDVEFLWNEQQQEAFEEIKKVHLPHPL